MLWGPSVWAGLRAGDAGNAEEELGVQHNTSVVYPTGRVALALRARRNTAQLDPGCIQPRLASSAQILNMVDDLD